jgi:hypothetical protein
MGRLEGKTAVVTGGIRTPSLPCSLVRSRGLEPRPLGYMHLKYARLPIPPRPQNSKLITPTSSDSYLKLVRLPLAPRRSHTSTGLFGNCALSSHAVIEVLVDAK